MAEFNIAGALFVRRESPAPDQSYEIIGLCVVGGVMMQVLMGQQDKREYAFASPQRGRREPIWMDVEGFMEARYQEMLNSDSDESEFLKFAKDHGWEIGQG